MSDDTETACVDTFKALFAGKSALVLEDDALMGPSVKRMLIEAGFASADLTLDGEAALAAARKRRYDILLLDRDTPVLDGRTALAQIRDAAGHCASLLSPAIFLTAFGSEAHRVEGLVSGADDYIVKPVSEMELLARIAAQLRRVAWSQAAPPHSGKSGRIVAGPLTMTPAAMEAVLFGQQIDLTGREFSILRTLAENAGLPVTRSMLWDRCWPEYKFEPDNFDNRIDVHISRLRRKLEPYCEGLPQSMRPLIVSVRTQGLMLRDLSGVASGAD